VASMDWERWIDDGQMLQTLKDMVAIPSVVGDEGALGDYVGQRLEQMGVAPIYQAVEEGRTNLCGFYGRPNGGPLLTMNGHLDTVEVCDGWTRPPFEPVEEDGRLYGLGVCDMKAGLAAMLEAFRVIVTSKAPLQGRLAFTAVPDEEAYDAGIYALMTTEIGQSDAAIVGEPYFGTTTLEKDGYTPLGRTGKETLEIVAHGRSAHAFFPERGVNAVVDMARFLSELDAVEFLDHPQIGRGNTCVLKIEGGYARYSVVVPDTCRVVMNRLTVPGEPQEMVLSQMRELAGSLGLGSRFEIRSIPPTYRPFVLDRNELILTAYDEAYRSVLGRAPEYGYHHSLNDANVFAGDHGIPTLVFGPNGANTHSPDEYVLIDSVRHAVRVYLHTIAGYFARATEDPGPEHRGAGSRNMTGRGDGE